MRSYPAALTFTLASVSFTCSPVAGFSSYLENMNAPASAKVPVAPAGSSGSYLATMSSISYSTPDVSAVPVVQASPASQEVASSFGNYLESMSKVSYSTPQVSTTPVAQVSTAGQGVASSFGNYLESMSSISYSTPQVSAAPVAQAPSYGNYLDSIHNQQTSGPASSSSVPSANGSYLDQMSSATYSTPPVSYYAFVPNTDATPTSVASATPTESAAPASESYLDHMSIISYATPSVSAAFMPTTAAHATTNNGSYLESL